MRNQEDESPHYGKKILAIALIVIIALVAVFTLTSAYKTVPTGYEGVVLSWGKPVRIVGAGLNGIAPIAEDIALVNIQVQKVTADESAASSDLQEVTTSITVNYQLDPTYAMDIYTNLRDQYESRVILPAMQDALKASTAKYQASELITNRDQVVSTIKDILQSKLNQYHIQITSVQVTNFKFSDQFQSAVDAKVTAEQNALAAQNQLAVIQFQAQQQVIQAEANATAISALAQGNANATLISANATAQAMKIVSSQLSPQYIQYLYAIGWDGKLPIYWVSGNGTAPYLMVTIPSNSTSTPTAQSTIQQPISNQVSNGVTYSLTLSQNATSTGVGDTIAITAQLSPSQSGVSVGFYNNGNLMGTATSNASGQAIYCVTRTDNSDYTFSAKVQ